MERRNTGSDVGTGGVRHEECGATLGGPAAGRPRAPAGAGPARTVREGAAALRGGRARGPLLVAGRRPGHPGRPGAGAPGGDGGRGGCGRTARLVLAVPPYTWHLGAEAVTRVEAEEFDATVVRSLCEADPATGRAVYREVAGLLAQRLQRSRARLLDLYAPYGSGPGE
ncbi:hypothetical protein DUI70_3192 [Streptomyces albus]|nr:hypothetical protein DUI70_3192 [Streptomyces albus]